jgi:AbrB family looped-hinge helix DNA binding protein
MGRLLCMISNTFHTIMSMPAHKPAFYGTATIGTKGQIVIPAKAREDLGLKSGEKVVVIGIKHHGMLGICPISSVEAMLTQTTAQLKAIQNAIGKTKES